MQQQSTPPNLFIVSDYQPPIFQTVPPEFCQNPETRLSMIILSVLGEPHLIFFESPLN